jgi:hypothetical protein
MGDRLRHAVFALFKRTEATIEHWNSLNGANCPPSLAMNSPNELVLLEIFWTPTLDVVLLS